MDAALVLASQGIEAEIHGPEGEAGWRLVVPDAELTRATAIMAEYERENRGWGWRKRWDKSADLFHPGVLVWCVVIGLIHWLDAYWRGALSAVGVVDKLAVLHGEWWRLATAVSLHSDAAHLAANATLGFIVIGFVLGRFGPGLGLLLAWLAGVAGNVPGLFLYPQPYRGLGASGMVMGAVGLLAVHSLGPFWRHPSGSKFLISGLFGASMIFLLMGTNPGTDVVAHLGGFLAGIAFGFPIALLPRKQLAKEWLQTACAWLLAILFAVTWVVAWKYSRAGA